MDDLGLLRLQLEWGADEALDEAPLDRLRPSAPGPAASPVVAPRPGPSVPVPAFPSSAARPGTPLERATLAAGRADSPESLQAAVAAFDGCALRDMATNPVFAAGDADAGLLLLGGAPGADEDRAGQPFAGREGALLDRMLASVGLRRETMLLAPLIPWRPPGGRVPTPAEIQLCRPFLTRLIVLTAPRRIVTFGIPAANAVLGGTPRPRRTGWVEATVEGRPVRLLPLPTLADLLKTPSRRAEAWAGMRSLRRALDGMDPLPGSP